MWCHLPNELIQLLCLQGLFGGGGGSGSGGVGDGGGGGGEERNTFLFSLLFLFLFLFLLLLLFLFLLLFLLLVTLNDFGKTARGTIRINSIIKFAGCDVKTVKKERF